MIIVRRDEFSVSAVDVSHSRYFCALLDPSPVSNQVLRCDIRVCAGSHPWNYGRTTYLIVFSHKFNILLAYWKFCPVIGRHAIDPVLPEI